jgi:DNA-binding CsgD family transcriptional regulator
MYSIYQEECMSRIVLIIDIDNQLTFCIDDPRPQRELVKLINSGRLRVGMEALELQKKTRQWAISLPYPPVILVVMQDPPVRLSARHYDVLFGLADGMRGAQIADTLGISRRTVYEYFSNLKSRFEVVTLKEVLARAAEIGLVYPRGWVDDHPTADQMV